MQATVLEATPSSEPGCLQDTRRPGCARTPGRIDLAHTLLPQWSLRDGSGAVAGPMGILTGEGVIAASTT
jgi:hypothetical protein